MTRYRVTGRRDARPWPFSFLTDRNPGDEIETDLDELTHNHLVGGGVLEVIPSAKPEAKVLPKAEPKSEPKVETKIIDHPKQETPKEAPRVETPKPSERKR